MAMSAAAAQVTPLVAPAWLNEHRSDPAIVVLDIRSAIDGGGAEAYAKGHIPGAVHSDYDKAGWRVTRNGVPFMLPTCRATREADRRDRHRRGQPRRHRAGGRACDRFRFGGARVLDAEGRGPPGGVDPRRWLRRLDGAGLSGRDRGQSAVAENLHRTLDKRLLADDGEVEAASRSGQGATLLDARPAGFFTGKLKAPAAKAYGHIPSALNLDSATFYDSATNRLRPQGRACRDRKRTAGRSGAELLQHRALGVDQLVRAVRSCSAASDVQLYAGSMVEWTADERRPVSSARTRWDDVKKALGLGS